MSHIVKFYLEDTFVFESPVEVIRGETGRRTVESSFTIDKFDKDYMVDKMEILVDDKLIYWRKFEKLVLIKDTTSLTIKYPQYINSLSFILED